MELLAKHITVTIVFDSKGTKCEGSCGLDWTSVESVTVIKKRINDRFGDTAELGTLDLSSDDKDVTELRKRISRNSYSLPLLLVNGEVRISGEFDARQLLDAIEVEQEINPIS